MLTINNPSMSENYVKKANSLINVFHIKGLISKDSVKKYQYSRKADSLLNRLSYRL